MVTSQQILDADLADWRKLAQALHARYRTGSFTAGLEFVTAVAAAAEEANHHPDVTLSYPHVDLRLLSHDVGAVTQRDLDLARTITAIAADRGVEAQPAAVVELEIALDTGDLAAAGPFWAALLTGDASAVQGPDLLDASGQLPTLWFQDTDPHPTPRQRFHLDLWVAPEVAAERIAAAVAAGGRVVDDTRAPTFVVLADPEGNKACVCTYLNR